MEVILKEDIVNLGKLGEVVRVRDGYARNYLLPRGLVLSPTRKISKPSSTKRNWLRTRSRR